MSETEYNEDIYIFPTSFAQQRLWVLDQLEPGNISYNIAAAIRLSGDLNHEALENSIAEIIRRHEILRTYFAMQEGAPCQIVTPYRLFSLSVISREHIATDEQEPEIRHLAEAARAKVFDLSTGPLFRVELLRLSPTEHVLLINMHHIVSDGWSIGVFIKELSVAYPAFMRGNSPPLQELQIQYADFAIWQRQWLTGDVLETQLQYWKQKLTGAPGLLELPIDHLRPPVQTFSGSTQSFSIDTGLSQGFQELCRNKDATLLMGLLGVFFVLLTRYTRQTDVVVGIPIANRNRQEIEPLIGFFINSLAIRIDMADNLSFQTVLSRVREAALDAYLHQDLPFELLVEALHPERDQRYSPLFQVMFILQNAPVGHLQLPGLQVTPLAVKNNTSKYDLTLIMEEGEKGLEGSFEYNTDLFDQDTIIRMIDHFKTLLAGVVSNPKSSILDLPILTTAEHHQLVSLWNNKTGFREPAQEGDWLPALLASQAEKFPHGVAVVKEGQFLTYSQLNTQANQLARFLIKMGIGPDVMVAVCIERSLEMLVILLGILKAGGAYVPLDPDFPVSRLNPMLEDAQPLMLLTHEKLAQQFSNLELEILYVEKVWQLISRESGQNPVVPPMLDTLAYTIYTSGSTGKPKGVQISHRALINFLFSMKHQLGLSQQDVLLAVTTISFDIAAMELFLPLILGGRVVLTHRAVCADGLALANTIQDYAITAMQATPVTWQLLLAAKWEGNPRLKAFCGGEAFPMKLADSLYSRCESVWNMYGPTETTIWSAVRKVNVSPQKDDSQDKPVTIGPPIVDTQLYILDPNLQPVPIGIPGHLHIGGIGLARGYINQPDLTAEKFIPDPFSSVPGQRLYKTGDLASFLPNGDIRFLGRMDFQIKIRGFRIEPGDIEAVLAKHAQIQNCAVTLRETTQNMPCLAAYIVPNTKEAPSVSELRSFLREKLPEYMIPWAFVFLETMPLTLNKKIDRKALPPLDKTKTESENELIPAHSSIERQLAAIWEDLLSIKQVAVNQNFFDLGGNSLLAIGLMRQIQEGFRAEVLLSDLFANPTIEKMARFLDSQEGSSQASLLIPHRTEGTKRPLFFVPGAGGQSFYLVDLVRHLEPDQPFYSFQAMGLDHSSEPLNSIPEFAQCYLNALKTIQPTGPYLLGGHSFGSHVAFEMARQLIQQGEKVQRLIVLDTVAPIIDERPFSDLRSKTSWMLEILRVLEMMLKTSSNISEEDLQVLDFEGQLKLVKQWLKTQQWPSLGNNEDYFSRQVDVYIKSLNIHYRPRTVLPLPLTLFLAKETVSQSRELENEFKQRIAAVKQDKYWGWGELTNYSIAVRHVPGNHNTLLMEPDVLDLALQLRKFLTVS
jgi:amino acid adenylation domain-containing protein